MMVNHCQYFAGDKLFSLISIPPNCAIGNCLIFVVCRTEGNWREKFLIKLNCLSACNAENIFHKIFSSSPELSLLHQVVGESFFLCSIKSAAGYFAILNHHFLLPSQTCFPFRLFFAPSVGWMKIRCERGKFLCFFGKYIFTQSKNNN